MASAPEPEPGAAGLPPSAAAAYAALRTRFLGGLAARWSEIARAADDKQRRDALHRLAGAAGGYGCPLLGALARRAEQAEGEALAAALGELQQRMTAPNDTVR